MNGRVLIAAAGLLAIASPDVAYAQRRVVVRMPPVTAAPPPTTKLAPPLQAAVAADARFTGTSRDGDPVLDIPAGRSTEDVIAAIRRVTPVVSIEDIATPEVTRIDQVIVLFDGGLPPDRNTLAGLSVSTRNRSGGWITVRSAEGFTANQLSAIAETPGVRFAEPDYRYWLLQAPASNDPDLRRQWGMEGIGAPRVWPTHHASSVLVAVLDTGADLDHEDLAANLWVNPGETPDGRDNDKNGLVDDIHGADFSDGDGNPSDPHGHGTHVAGIIGAVGNNAKGVAGVNWSIKMMVIRMVAPAAPDTDPSAPGSGIAAAIDYAVTNGAKVLNNSWGGGPFSVAIFEAITRSEKAGALFVAAAGNGGLDQIGDDNDATPLYPASHPHANIISVASVDRTDRLAASSNFGRNSVHLAAPGVRVYSTLPGDDYDLDDGTSMAAPHVAGAIALVWSHPQFSALSPADIKKLILDNVRRVPGLKGTTVTGGVLDLSFVPAPTSPAPPPAPERDDPARQVSSPTGKPERVQLEGRVRTDYAIGGETTGWVLEFKTPTEKIPSSRVELSFTTEQQRRVAEQAMKAGLPVIVIGDVRAMTGIEIRRRLILTVAEITTKKDD